MASNVVVRPVVSNVLSDWLVMVIACNAGAGVRPVSGTASSLSSVRNWHPLSHRRML